MRILVVSQYFWPENFRINDLAAALVERGHEVIVLTGLPNYPSGRLFKGYGLFGKRVEEYCGVKVQRVPLIPRGGGGSLRLAANYLSFAVSGSLFTLSLLRQPIDLILACQLSPVTAAIPAVLLKKLKKLPLILWTLDLWPESLSATGAIKSRAVMSAADLLVRWIYKASDRILVASEGFIPSIVQRGIPEERVSFFPNWYETEYGASCASPPFDVPPMPEGFRVMFAGAVGAAQDFETILEAATNLKQHSDLHWVIVGGGRRLEWVKEQLGIRGLEHSVHLLGQYPSWAMPAFFSKADVMLATLKKDPTFALTIPGKLQSYMASGKPIIAALEGEGARLIKKSGAGISCPPEDPIALADSVLAMYAMSKSEREAIGRSGQRYSESNFRRENLMNKLEGWLREATEGKAALRWPSHTLHTTQGS